MGWTGSDWNALECAGLHLILKFKMMGLELAVHLLEHFAGTFPGDIYIWPNVHSCCILVILVLLVTLGWAPASACAERLLVCARHAAKLERPPGCTTLVCLGAYRQLLWVKDRFYHWCKHRMFHPRAAGRQANTLRTDEVIDEKGPHKLYDRKPVLGSHWWRRDGPRSLRVR